MSTSTLVDATATTLSWIPSEAVTGAMRPVFDIGFAHYDVPPPDRIDDLEALRAADRFRFANVLHARVRFEEGVAVDIARDGGGIMGATTMRLGPVSVTVAAVGMPDIIDEPERGDGWVTLRQTCGGKAGAPGPRLRAGGGLTLEPPLVWTTLAVTLHADGRSEYALEGASAFPRHWVYGPDGALALKAGTTDFRGWMSQESHAVTPWGAVDSPVVVTAVESALERTLSRLIMGTRHRVRSLPGGAVLLREGDPGDTLLLLLDGVVEVSAGGAVLGRLGPGTVLGERAVREGGFRTATVNAVTAIRVAEVPADAVDPAALDELTGHHQRERSAQASG